MTHLRRITKALLTSSHIWSALIAILTSAIVALLSVSFNWWLLASWLFFLATIFFLSKLLKVTQLVQSRQFELLKTTSPELIVDDAFRDTIDLLFSPKGDQRLTEKEIDNKVINEERTVIGNFFLVCFLSLVGCGLAWKGVDLKNKNKDAEYVRINTMVVDSILSRYDSRSYEKLLQIDDRIIELTDSTQKNASVIKDVRAGVDILKRRVDRISSQDKASSSPK